MFFEFVQDALSMVHHTNIGFRGRHRFREHVSEKLWLWEIIRLFSLVQRQIALFLTVRLNSTGNIVVAPQLLMINFEFFV